jgi:hypothetical protein
MACAFLHGSNLDEDFQTGRTEEFDTGQIDHKASGSLPDRVSQSLPRFSCGRQVNVAGQHTRPYSARHRSQ